MKKKILIVFIIGFLLYILSFAADDGSELIDGNKIERNSYGKGKREVVLNVKNERYMVDEQITVEIDEIKYSNQEIQSLLDKLRPELSMLMLNDNASFENVTSDMYFPAKVEGYPFEISYGVSEPLLISKNGKIDSKKIEERDINHTGIPVSITVEYKYFDFDEIEIFNLLLFKKEKDFKEQFIDLLYEKLQYSNEAKKTDMYYYLPTSVGGVDVEYYEDSNNNRIYIVFLTFIAVVLIVYGSDKDKQKELMNKNKQMISDYPKIVNKFAVFFCAGMSVKNIWHKLCEDYKNEKGNGNVKRYIFEEMIVSDILMNEGLSEIEAYEDFAKRVSIPKYKSFVNILKQAVIKGKKDIGTILVKESEASFDERKINAKRYMEEASTKLLGPMFMMLIIVMIMIMYPAFSSFSY